MPLTVNFSISPPVLPDDDVWFANSLAWTNYWRGVGGTATLSPATTTVYSHVDYDTTLVPCYQDIDGTQYILVTTAMFDSLRARLDALNAAFELMRNELKTAGIISESQ